MEQIRRSGIHVRLGLIVAAAAVLAHAALVQPHRCRPRPPATPAKVERKAAAPPRDGQHDFEFRAPHLEARSRG